LVVVGLKSLLGCLLKASLLDFGIPLVGTQPSIRSKYWIRK
jgi:hypothetical protein